IAAVLWGLNFSSVYPVLKLLNDKEPPQQWVDGCIAKVQAGTDREAGIYQLDPRAKEAQDKLRELENQPSTAALEKEKRDATNDLAKVERKLAAARTLLWRYQVARKYIYLLAPADPFRALAWVIGILVAAAA